MQSRSDAVLFWYISCNILVFSGIYFQCYEGRDEQQTEIYPSSGYGTLVSRKSTLTIAADSESASLTKPHNKL